jgi:hypothetical protein
MATSKKPPASKSTAIQPWEAEMAAAAKKQSAVEKPMGLFKSVNIQGGVMTIDDKKVPGNAIRAVVLAATHENQYYDSPFTPGVAAVPACFSFGDQALPDPEAEMRPHPDSRSPQGDDDGKCAGCWANKMASADTGKGKACGNVRRLIITTEDALESPEAMAEAEARSLKVPVMSVRNWIKFVHEIDEDMLRPYWGVIVNIKVVPDQKSQFQVLFEFEELITFDAALYAATKKRVAQAAKDIVTPYPKLEAPVAAPAKGKPAAKTPTGPATRAKGKF